MKAYRDIITEIDPTANVERVLDIADATYRYFGEMTRDEWAACVEASRF